jgi:hypothetical protein
MLFPNSPEGGVWSAFVVKAEGDTTDMTFIVAASTDEFAMQVADTLLTNPDGSKYADKLVKTTIIHCRDAKLLISYTGLAIIDGVRTDKWLVARLNEFEASRKVFVEIGRFLAERLSAALKSNPAFQRHGLTLVINGLGVSPAGKHQQAVAIVSNMETPIPKYNSFVYAAPKGRSFGIFFLDPPRWYMSVHGAVSETLNVSGHRKKIIRELKSVRTQEQARRFLDGLVAMLRLQRTDPRLGRLIGDDCTASVIQRDYNSNSYFYSKTSTVHRYPNIVRPEGTVENFTIAPG